MFAGVTGVTVSVLPSDLISGCKKDFCKNFCVRLQSSLFPTSGNNNCSVKTLLRLLNPHLQLQKNAVYSFSPPDKNALVERRECDNSIWHILFLIKSFLKHKRNESRNISFYNICQMSDNNILRLCPQ